MTTWQRLAAFALAVSVTHHVGAVRLGAVGPVTGSTLLDLLTPWFVVGTALLALHSAGTDRRGWLLAVAGSLAYVHGHGIHLAANSISDETERAGASPSEATHLWDEVVGHWLWYAGLALLVAVLARRLAGEPRPAGPWPVLLALPFGVTWATNGLEGGTALGSLAAAAAALVLGARTRRTAGSLLVWAALPAVVVLVGWGLMHAGWPQPSSL